MRRIAEIPQGFDFEPAFGWGVAGPGFAPGRQGGVDTSVAVRVGEPLGELLLQQLHLGIGNVIPAEGPEEERVLVDQFAGDDRRIVLQRYARVGVAGGHERGHPFLDLLFEFRAEEGQGEGVVAVVAGESGVAGRQINPKREIGRHHDVDSLLPEGLDREVQAVERPWLDLGPIRAATLVECTVQANQVDAALGEKPGQILDTVVIERVDARPEVDAPEAQLLAIVRIFKPRFGGANPSPGSGVDFIQVTQVDGRGREGIARGLEIEKPGLRIGCIGFARLESTAGLEGRPGEEDGIISGRPGGLILLNAESMFAGLEFHFLEKHPVGHVVLVELGLVQQHDIRIHGAQFRGGGRSVQGPAERPVFPELAHIDLVGSVFRDLDALPLDEAGPGLVAEADPFVVAEDRVGFERVGRGGGEVLRFDPDMVLGGKGEGRTDQRQAGGQASGAAARSSACG